MAVAIKIKSLTKEKIDEYIEVGKKSYLQHYKDFWVDGDPSPYINESFTNEVLEEELQDLNSELFIIYSDKFPVGILKIILDKSIGDYTEEESLLLQKIYLLKESSGKGIGSKVLNFVENFAKEQHKKMVWLDAMVKGKAIPFYQKNGYQIHSTKKLHYKNYKDEKREMYNMIKKLA